MNELSLHLLDIAQNGLAAGATLIEISVEVDTAADRMALTVRDNGRGMSAEALARVRDPFYTTRTTRGVGLGIPLFKMSAEAAGGCFSMESTPGAGTCVRAEYGYSHIDRMPLGDMGATLASLIGPNENVDFVYTYARDGEVFTLDTRELREVLGEVPLSSPEVLEFIQSSVPPDGPLTP